MKKSTPQSASDKMKVRREKQWANRGLLATPQTMAAVEAAMGSWAVYARSSHESM